MLLKVHCTLHGRISTQGFFFLLLRVFVDFEITPLDGVCVIFVLSDQVSYEEARDELMKLKGVGRKVADCVCLMALDKHDIVPVDTHVFQVAARDYLPKFAAGKKSLTPTVMAEIGKDIIDILWLA